jgi:hypothetical protein
MDKHPFAAQFADHIHRRGLHEVEVHLYTPEPQPMPVADPQLGEAVTKMLSSKGVAFHPFHRITSVNSLCSTYFSPPLIYFSGQVNAFLHNLGTHFEGSWAISLMQAGPNVIPISGSPPYYSSLQVCK